MVHRNQKCLRRHYPSGVRTSFSTVPNLTLDAMLETLRTLDGDQLWDRSAARSHAQSGASGSASSRPSGGKHQSGPGSAPSAAEQHRAGRHIHDRNLVLEPLLPPTTPDAAGGEGAEEQPAAADTAFRDVNSSRDLPPVSMQQIALFLEKFHSDGGSAYAMYDEKFLQFLRYSKDNQDSKHFYKGYVSAEMYKNDDRSYTL
ncbi:hypothetical protein FOCC_FOCC007320 [Frankliniella occidentalis]|nr:hypothetical protein FOCC_FOCC007320 [Frankliniella occidentalis]